MTVDGAEIWDFHIKETGHYFSALVEQRQTFFVVYRHMTSDDYLRLYTVFNYFLLVILKIFQIHIKFDACQNTVFTKIIIMYLVN